MSAPPIRKQPAPSQAATASWSEARLLEALLAGERGAAGVLYDHLRVPIESTLRRVLHQRGPDFEDLVQVTFERILRGLAERRFAGRSSLRTWACAIAGHVALDALQKNRRERQRDADWPSDETLLMGPHSDQRLESLAELRRVHGILLDMKPELAEALILHDVLGHQISEISALRGATQSATQSRLFRARAELKRRALKTIPWRKR